jgi:hypothetical protein
VVDDAGRVGQRLQSGQIGGLADVRVGRDAGDHIGPRGGVPGALVGVVGHAVQDEPEREHGGGRRDRQQEERGLGGASPQVPGGEAAHK